MGHRHHGAREAGEELLQPFHRFGVEVVGRLVEQQHVGLGQQQPTERDAALLAARERADLGLPGRQPQRVGGDFELVVEVAAGRGQDGLVLGLIGGELVEVGVGLGVGGIDRVELGLRLEHFAHALFHRLAHRLLRIELRFLGQVADLDPGHGHRLAFDLLVQSGHDLQHRRLARAVQSEHADLGAGEEGQRDVLEDLALGRDDLADAVHGENVLGHAIP
ncbi:hypothetical protein GALL_217880 [mine drainage metagenome]|uniref:NAD-specific glutamate dehydrogenase n=1 Tax=mine drainage metagenome TaxID=410659 RepID=A0A1J5RVZ8_9ZZZZ